MHTIYFYKDKNGNEPVLDYMRELASKKSKDSRIKLNKLNDYIELLSQHGTRAGEPYIKHLEDEIWELRPLRDRIFICGLAWWEFSFSYIILPKRLRKLLEEKLKKPSVN